MLVVQWLRLCASTAGGVGSSPGWELRFHMSCDFAKQKKEILTHDPTWMSLEDIMLSEMCWSQKSKRCMVPLT